IHQGFDKPFSSFCDEIVQTGSARWREWVFPFHYENFIVTMAALPGIEIVVRSYDHPSSGSPILEFFSSLGIPITAAAEELPHENRRPNLGDTIGRYWSNRGIPLDDADLSEMTELCAKLPERRLLMSAARQAQFVAAFDSSNRRLCERYRLPRIIQTR